MPASWVSREVQYDLYHDAMSRVLLLDRAPNFTPLALLLMAPQTINQRHGSTKQTLEIGVCGFNASPLKNDDNGT